MYRLSGMMLPSARTLWAVASREPGAASAPKKFAGKTRSPWAAEAGNSVQVAAVAAAVAVGIAVETATALRAMAVGWSE